MSHKSQPAKALPAFDRQPVIAEASVATVRDQIIVSSEANRKKLQGWSESSSYKSISFWIPPNMQPGTDECVAEVANALIKFEADKKAGLIESEADFSL